MNVWSLLWFTLTRDQGIGTDVGKKEGKKGDSESGEVIYDNEIDSEIVPGGHERNMTEKEVKKEGNKEGKKGDSESGEDIWGEEMTEEELKEWNKEYVGMLKKKLERFEKKSKKNGKLTQKEEERKRRIIQRINFIEDFQKSIDVIASDATKIAMEYQSINNLLAGKGHDYTIGPEINAQIIDEEGDGG